MNWAFVLGAFFGVEGKMGRGLMGEGVGEGELGYLGLGLEGLGGWGSEEGERIGDNVYNSNKIIVYFGYLFEPMNLISMYSQKPPKQQQPVHPQPIHPYPQPQIQKLLSAISSKQRPFTATITSPALNARNQILCPSETVSFSLLQPSKNINYEYMFQVEVNLVTNLWRIVATVVRNGRIINICKQGLIQMLSGYSLNVNAYMNCYTLRIHPFTGVLRFVFITHCTTKQVVDIFRFPVNFCEQVEEHVQNMTNRLDERILGKILHITNQIPITSILPPNLPSKLPQQTPEYINKLKSQNPLFTTYNLSSLYKKYRIIRQTRKYITNSNIRYSFLTRDPETHKIRFLPEFHHRKEFQKEHRVVRHNIKVIPFCRDVRRVLALYTSLETLQEGIQGHHRNFDITDIQPTPEEVKDIYDILKVDLFMVGGRILTPIIMHSVESEAVMCQGGFGQISRVLANISARQQPQNPQKSNPQPPKILRQSLIRKSAPKQKLFWQKSVIHYMGMGSCVFINKYYEPKLDPEAVGIDKGYLDGSLFMEYCQEKSLNNYLNKFNSIMSMKVKIFLLSQAIIGLRYLRDFGIVHLDMKPENLLVKIAASVTSSAFALIKIIDFGQAYCQTLIGKKINRGHTCPYASPQLVRQTQTKYTQKSDVFSIGVMILIIIFQLNTVQLKRLTSTTLFQSNQKYIKFYSICVQKCKYLGYEPQMLSLLNLAYKCINPIPSSRPYLDWICVVFRSLLGMFQYLEGGGV